jgi:hypothetical protein
MALRPVLASIIGWLRAGYPDGVPEHDYVPLLALLSSRLTEEDIREIADGLATAGDPASAKAIHEAIRSVTHGRPLDADIARVNERLTAVGWPPATEESTPSS